MAIKSGKFDTLFPADFKLPMVSPGDIGTFAAQLMQEKQKGTFYIQAEEQYAANDAVAILNHLLDKNIKVNEIEKKDWASYKQRAGFSPSSTNSFIGMTELTLNEKFEAQSPYFGKTTLKDYFDELLEKLSEKQKADE